MARAPIIETPATAAPDQGPAAISWPMGGGAAAPNASARPAPSWSSRDPETISRIEGT